MMFASFHSEGTTPSFNDKLNTLYNMVVIRMERRYKVVCDYPLFPYFSLKAYQLTFLPKTYHTFRITYQTKLFLLTWSLVLLTWSLVLLSRECLGDGQFGE